MENIAENQELLERIAELEGKLANANAKGTGLRVSPKGGVSFYGVGRFPVTLYRSQWVKLIAAIPDIEAFIEANAGLLAEKAPKE